jgi:hypothetical protein
VSTSASGSGQGITCGVTKLATATLFTWDGVMLGFNGSFFNFSAGQPGSLGASGSFLDMAPGERRCCCCRPDDA